MKKPIIKSNEISNIFMCGQQPIRQTTTAKLPVRAFGRHLPHLGKCQRRIRGVATRQWVPDGERETVQTLHLLTAQACGIQDFTSIEPDGIIVGQGGMANLFFAGEIDTEVCGRFVSEKGI